MSRRVVVVRLGKLEKLASSVLLIRRCPSETEEVVRRVLLLTSVVASRRHIVAQWSRSRQSSVVDVDGLDGRHRVCGSLV